MSPYVSRRFHGFPAASSVERAVSEAKVHNCATPLRVPKSDNTETAWRDRNRPVRVRTAMQSVKSGHYIRTSRQRLCLDGDAAGKVIQSSATS